jgi:CRP-like cAMP-binding protein
MTTLAVELARVDLLADLPRNSLAAVAAQVRTMRHGAGAVVLDADDGSSNRDVFLVLEGVVDVINYALTGREVSFARIESGGYFGELSAIDGLPRSARVVAATDCRFAALSPQLFDRLVTEEPTVARKVMLRLARIIRACDERIMDLSTLRAVERVAVEILRLARPSDGNTGAPGRWVVDRLPAQRDIAARVGTARETVARVLSQLQEDGVVERRGRMLVVPDRMRLLRVAAGDRPEALLAR